MKVYKKAVIMVLVVVLASVPSFGCASKSNSSSLPESQLATVQRGDLIVDITGSGNLAISHKVDLAFEVLGTVEEVLVEVGDSVKKEQVLAKLDASAWESELLTLELNLIQAKINLKTAELNLEKAKNPLTTRIESDRPQPDPLDIEIKELQVQLAKGRLVDAQKKLDDAKKIGPLIRAPFDGFITKVNVLGGDEVKKGTVAVCLADPTQFEADILVNEMDIFKVKLGGDVNVQVNAMSMVTFPAKVKFISPTATIQSGVVNYQVKLEVTSLQPIAASQSGGSRSTTGASQRQALPTQAIQSTLLKEGLTVTTSILVEKRENVLLVPNQTVLRRGKDTFVQVVKDGVVAESLVKTGISNWQWTEVMSGLNEGDKVVIPQAPAPTQATQQQPSIGGMRMPSGIPPVRVR